ncbi:hypothetical protein NB231_02793 [Nitrococcus mobilis Nb-231]|uniref:Methyltransferase domain-containing protein n=2 Tax=Nitrococcus mobilis TaxID=35797 RepID=A4BRT8_9GAMM|nr:hypothetical protein NB231_02793 [Nitrococcus mobilis Nb-231]
MKETLVAESAAAEAVISDPYDESLLDRARMQWQFGDWENLVQLDRDLLKNHPDRAKLALLVACAWQQMENHVAARHFVQLAFGWGCDRKLIAQLLVAGVYNTLGRAATLSGEENRALDHFRSSVGGVSGDSKLACQARTVREITRLDLLSHAGKVIEQSIGAIALSANASQQTGNQAAPAVSTPEQGMDELVDCCVNGDDVHALVDEQLDSGQLTEPRKFEFFCLLSDRFLARNDNITALHFLMSARDFVRNDDDDNALLLLRKLNKLGCRTEALDLLVERSLSDARLSLEERTALQSTYEQSQVSVRTQGEHGHELLLAYLKSQMPRLREQLEERQAVLIEIGTTRENVPGQGSTRKLAEHCKAAGIHFITVDMDPHNAREAAKLFQKLGVQYKAVTCKGENFLREYDGPMDFVFLDAYDFDHGKHSERRQSRYNKFLGAPIDETECHRMHLDCAQSVARKLSPFGVICIDDTWLDDGLWCAKGTLAMPYLMENDFELVDVRNRAALLRRRK